MTTKQIKVYAYMGPEYMFEKGIKAGMSEKVADYFRYFQEVPLILTVEMDTGKVEGVEVSSDVEPLRSKF